MTDEKMQKTLFKAPDTSDKLSYFYKNASVENAIQIIKLLVTRKIKLYDISRKDGQAIIAFLIKTYPQSSEQLQQVAKKHIVKREHKYLSRAVQMAEERKDAKDPLDLEHYWEDTCLQLDIMWIGFSITGDVKYVNRIIDALESGTGGAIYLGSMYWSIESMAKLHEPVYRELLTRAFVKKSKNPHLLKMLERIRS